MILLDSDVMIDVLARKEPSRSFLRDLRDRGEDLGTTSVSAAEVLRGAYGSGEALVTRLQMLDALAEVPIGPRAARRYGELMHTLDRAGASISVSDGLIAAATLEAGAKLVTRNVRHFDRVAGLEVLVPGGADGSNDGSGDEAQD